jgi:hypothetical protein
MAIDIRRCSKEDLDELNTHASLWPRLKPAQSQSVVASNTSLERIAETRKQRHALARIEIPDGSKWIFGLSITPCILAIGLANYHEIPMEEHAQQLGVTKASVSKEVTIMRDVFREEKEN